VRLALALVLLAGCGGVHPQPGASDVTLGTTNLDGSGFLPLSGDQTLVPGAQGGFHVWLKYRVTNMPTEKVQVHRVVRRTSDNALILTADGTVELGPPGDDGAWQLPTAIPSFMCPTPIGVRVMDEEVHFDLTLTDESGVRLGEGTATATPRCPTDAQSDFCARICAG
jgi:hypothetical protein